METFIRRKAFVNRKTLEIVPFESDKLKFYHNEDNDEVYGSINNNSVDFDYNEQYVMYDLLTKTYSIGVEVDVPVHKPKFKIGQELYYTDTWNKTLKKSKIKSINKQVSSSFSRVNNVEEYLKRHMSEYKEEVVYHFKEYENVYIMENGDSLTHLHNIYTKVEH